MGEHNLVVAEAFNDYRRGDMIDDPTEVQAILDSEHAHKVRKINK